MNNKFLLGLFLLPFSYHTALATPSNEELYKMLLEVKNEQTKLKQQLFESKQRERNLQSELAATRSKLFDTRKSITQPAGNQTKELERKEGFFATAGAIYVRPMIDDSGININPSQTDTYDNTLISQNMDFEPGLQVSAGYQASDNWDYTLKFKHFNAKESSNTSLPSSSVSHLEVGFGQNLLGSTPAPLHSDYKMDYNALDFEVGKQVELSENVSIRLSGGLRYAALAENWSDTRTVSNNGFQSVLTGPEIIGSESLIVKEERKYSGGTDFWGIGPRITASPSWKPFSNNFRVFGNVGASLLMGQYELSRQYNDAYIHANKEGFFPIVEAGAGIGYDIDMGLVALDIQAGYQLEHWLDSDLTDHVLFRGFHGSYGTIGVKF